MKDFFKKNFVLLLFFASVLVLLIVAAFTMTVMQNAATVIGQSNQERMVGLAQAAGFMVTAEELDQFEDPEDMKTPEYLALQKRIIAFNDSAGTEFTYFLRLLPDEDKMRFIIDNTAENPTALEEPPVGREEAPDLALLGQANAVPLGSYSDGWEGYLTAFAPVFHADGSPSNYVAGVDMLDHEILEMHNNMILMSVVLIVALALVIGISLVCMLLYQRKAALSEEASRSKSSFLSNMSHEMRTPLNAIIGMTEIAKSSDDVDRLKYCLERVDVAAGHLLGVINDVLDISKIEAGKLTLSPTTFKLKDTLHRIGVVIRYRAEEKYQEFVVEVDPDTPPVIIADEQQLSQVMTNLLANAVKFTPEKGKVTLRVGAKQVNGDEYLLKVSVTDSGIGMSEEQQQRLFSSFQQADNSISRRFGGTGLGLAICKGIVEAMDGKIWVTSTPGEGSTFSFTVKVLASHDELPDEQTDAVDEEEVSLEADYDSGLFKDKRILLAEDVEINQEILIALLEISGITIDVAEDGKVALEMFSANPRAYDAILMDIHMPNMDGYEATRRIRNLDDEWGAQVPIIAMTANVYREDVERCLANGMNAHLGKPIDVTEVFSKLRKYLLK